MSGAYGALDITDPETRFGVHCRLIKDGVDLTMVVDGYKSATMLVPKRLHLNKHVWLGGIHHREHEDHQRVVSG